MKIYWSAVAGTAIGSLITYPSHQSIPRAIVFFLLTTALVHAFLAALGTFFPRKDENPPE